MNIIAVSKPCLLKIIPGGPVKKIPHNSYSQLWSIISCYQALRHFLGYCFIHSSSELKKLFSSCPSIRWPLTQGAQDARSPSAAWGRQWGELAGTWPRRLPASGSPLLLHTKQRLQHMRCTPRWHTAVYFNLKRIQLAHFKAAPGWAAKRSPPEHPADQSSSPDAHSPSADAAFPARLTWAPPT